MHICFRLHFQVCICRAHKSVFVPIPPVCVCVPSSLPVSSQGPIWLLWGPLLHGASVWFMGAGQPQLLSHFHRFTSHTSQKKQKNTLHTSQLPPLSHRQTRSAETIFLGRILQEMLAIIYICLRPSVLRNPCLFLIWELLCKAIFPLPFLSLRDYQFYLKCHDPRYHALMEGYVCKLQPTFQCVLFPLSLPLNSLCILITHFLSLVFSAFTLANDVTTNTRLPVCPQTPGQTSPHWLCNS